jgi:hypothetical protein
LCLDTHGPRSYPSPLGDTGTSPLGGEGYFDRATEGRLWRRLLSFLSRYAVRRSSIRLEALTTTFCNADTGTTTDNALRALELLGRPDIPVAKEVARSLIHPVRPPRGSRPWLERDRRYRASGAEDPRDRRHASDLVIRRAKENPSHTAAARARGMTDAQHAELIAV